MKTTKFNSRFVVKLQVLVSGIVTAVLLSIAVLYNSSIVSDSSSGAPPSCCGPKCRIIKNRPSKHYDQSYFKWQTKLGMKKAREKDWSDFLGVKETDSVADLGAGGGHILATLNVRKRIAVEVNDAARLSIQESYPGKIESYQYPEDVPNDSIDILFSTSALEHFECPLTELREMSKKVKHGGRVVVGIKNEGLGVGMRAIKNDRHRHIYTWNFQHLQNLLNFAGFEVIEFEPNVSQALEHARNLSFPHSFKSFQSDLYIWVRGVKL